MSVKISFSEWTKAAFGTVSSKPENAFTAKEVAEQSGGNLNTVRNKLCMAVLAGRLTKGKFYFEGKVTNYYLLNEAKGTNGRGASKADLGTAKKTRHGIKRIKVTKSAKKEKR